MKIKELRIGNWIHKSLLDKSISIDYQIKASDFKEWENAIYKPIVLTEKRLKNLGFNKKGEWLSREFNPRMEIRFYKGNSAECDIVQGGKHIAFKYNHVRYVHRLQNLFFELADYEIN